MRCCPRRCFPIPFPCTMTRHRSAILCHRSQQAAAGEQHGWVAATSTRIFETLRSWCAQESAATIEIRPPARVGCPPQGLVPHPPPEPIRCWPCRQQSRRVPRWRSHRVSQAAGSSQNAERPINVGHRDQQNEAVPPTFAGSLIPLWDTDSGIHQLPYGRTGSARKVQGSSLIQLTSDLGSSVTRTTLCYGRINSRVGAPVEQRHCDRQARLSISYLCADAGRWCTLVVIVRRNSSS